MFIKAFLILQLITATALLGFTWKQVQDAQVRKDLPMLLFNPDINTPGKHAPIIRLHDLRDKEFFCSGTVISKNYAVTAGHCLAGHSKTTPSISIFNELGEDTEVTATAVFYNARTDQGLILGDFSGFNAMKFAVNSQAIMSTLLTQERLVVACGFPQGSNILCSPLQYREQSLFFIKGTGFLYPGMSGGPVVDVDTGILLGTNFAVLESGILIAPILSIFDSAKVKLEGQ